ncbi:MAG: hypothetical protein ACREPR_17530 [Brasilonema sp.]
MSTMDLHLIEENWHYYNGNLFDFWIGIKPDTQTEEGQALADDISRMFQEINVISEVVTRHADALLGRDPTASFNVGNSNLNELELQSANIAIADYLARTLGTPVGNSDFPDPIYESLLNLLVGGVSYLRATTVDGTVYLHCPPVESVKIVTRDAIGRPRKIEYYYVEEDKKIVETQYLNETRQTVFEYYEVGKQSPYYTFSINLGGRLTITEGRRRPFITKSMKTAQNAINHAATLIPRNNQISGFVSRIFLNAKLPGEFQTDETTGKRVFIKDPEAIVIAPGMLNFISGVAIKDEQGLTRGYTSPTVHTEQPVEIKTFVDAATFSLGTIYSQANQSHLLANDLTLSGRSRQELRNDFVIALLKDSRELHRMIDPMITER